MQHPDKKNLVCVGLFCLWDGLVKFCTQLVPVHFMFPVVDRLCFALARQCRKKNVSTGMYAAGCIPKNGQKPTPSTLLDLHEICVV